MNMNSFWQFLYLDSMTNLNQKFLSGELIAVVSFRNLGHCIILIEYSRQSCHSHHKRDFFININTVFCLSYNIFSKYNLRWQKYKLLQRHKYFAIFKSLFIHLWALFTLFDLGFIKFWNSSKSNFPSPSWSSLSMTLFTCSKVLNMRPVTFNFRELSLTLDTFPIWD